MTLITMQNWPRAIAHIDADGFFASVEQAIHPELKGKPVVTGAERGIVSAVSYEAKALGIKRGIPLHEVKKMAPNCVLVPSDYETYSLFSKRIFSIIRRFTPAVEEYSIDEAFADLTGLRKLHRGSYKDIAAEIQETISNDLGITVSVGVSLSKSLAKLCSKFQKPNGLTTVSGRDLNDFLPKINVEDVWGFGPNISALLRKQGVETAYDFVMQPRTFASKLIGKVGSETWMELTGSYVNKLNPELKRDYASISKTKTFTPASRDREFVLAQLIRNIESACIKARRHELHPKGIIIYIKTSDFKHLAIEAKLNRPSASPIDLVPIAKELFKKIFKRWTPYRATGVVLTGLEDAHVNQFQLFEDPLKVIETEKLSSAIDQVNAKYGKHTIFLANGLYLEKNIPERNVNIPTIDCMSSRAL